jgi:hypothetical protein
MSESGLGISVAATRQKAGRVLKIFGVCPGPVMGSAPATGPVACAGLLSRDRLLLFVFFLASGAFPLYSY